MAFIEYVGETLVFDRGLKSSKHFAREKGETMFISVSRCVGLRS